MQQCQSAALKRAVAPAEAAATFGRYLSTRLALPKPCALCTAGAVLECLTLPSGPAFRVCYQDSSSDPLSGAAAPLSVKATSALAVWPSSAPKTAPSSIEHVRRRSADEATRAPVSTLTASRSPVASRSASAAACTSALAPEGADASRRACALIELKFASTAPACSE